MLQIKDRPNTTPEQAKAILTRHSQECGLLIDLDVSLRYISFFKEYVKLRTAELAKMANKFDITITNKNEIIGILCKRFEVPIELLYEDSDKPALNEDTMEVVLHSEYVRQEAKDFLNLYRDVSSKAYLESYLYQYINGPVIQGESWNGHRIVRRRPTWEILTTARLSAKDPSLQNLTKSIGDIITYLAGTILLRTDSGQIEPRITYSEFVRDPLIKELIIVYNDAYLGLLRYTTMTIEEEIFLRTKYKLTYDGYREVVSGKVITSADIMAAETLCRPCELEAKLSDEDRSNLKKLLLAGNYGGNLVHKFPYLDLAKPFMDRVQQHPLRLKMQVETSKAVDHGKTVFTTPFGTDITPKPTKKYSPQKDMRAWLNHLKRCAVNNPIQGAAADLMNESVYQADKIIVSKAKFNTHILYYKHDEGAFMVDERDAPKVLDELKDITAYQVRDWIPIYADAEIGVKGGTPEWQDLNAIRY